MKAKGMIKILLTGVGMVIIIGLLASFKPSVLSATKYDTPCNKSIEVVLSHITRITLDLGNADVSFYTGKGKNIEIIYNPMAFDPVPDYSGLQPEIKTVKKEYHIKLQNLDYRPQVTVYIPSTVEGITLIHKEGTLRFYDDVTAQLTVKGDQSDIKVNYIQSLLNINISEGNVSVMKGKLPEGSSIKVKVGNISVDTGLEDGDYLFSTEYGNIDFKSSTKGIAVSAIGYTRLNDFPAYQAGKTFVTLDSKVGCISASAGF